MSVSLVPQCSWLVVEQVRSGNKAEVTRLNHSQEYFGQRALDGYLHNAKVCLDKNINTMCDSADGKLPLRTPKDDFS